MKKIAKWLTAAASKGNPALYHETITWAYLLLIHERKARGESDETWEQFAARNPDLLSWKPSVLDGYYREETLASELARRVFVMPDRSRFRRRQRERSAHRS